MLHCPREVVCPGRRPGRDEVGIDGSKTCRGPASGASPDFESWARCRGNYSYRAASLGGLVGGGAHSKCRYEICRRTDAAANWEWRRHQQEIPALAFRRRIRERFQVAIVEQMHAEIQKRKVVNGAAEIRWGNVLRMVAAEDGDVALLEPGMTGGSRRADLPPSARPRSHGPAALRRAHTPVRTNKASPADTLTPAFRSHASRSLRLRCSFGRAKRVEWTRAERRCGQAGREPAQRLRRRSTVAKSPLRAACR
jgi:hypothetical protein